eukprot:3647679-Alexandrium_andersonii.AAC.1
MGRCMTCVALGFRSQTASPINLALAMHVPGSVKFHALSFAGDSDNAEESKELRRRFEEELVDATEMAFSSPR